MYSKNFNKFEESINLVIVPVCTAINISSLQFNKIVQFIY